MKNYISTIEPNPFVLRDFYNKTKFSIRSTNNNYKSCCVMIDDVYCGDNGITTMTIVVWDGLHGYGRHIVAIVNNLVKGPTSLNEC